MPNLTTMVLKDRLGTDHTFTPDDIRNGIASLVESTGVPIGDRRIVISGTQTAQGRRKVNLRMSVPVVTDSVVNGVAKPTVVRTSYLDMTFTFDGASNFNERADMQAFAAYLLDNAGVQDSIKNLTKFY